MFFHFLHRPSINSIVAMGIVSVIAIPTPLRADDEPRNEANPMSAEVPAPPATITAPLSEAEYQKRFAKALQDMGPVPPADQMPLSGVLITGVMPQSPAADAGLHAGDIIIRFADTATPTVHDLKELLDKTTEDCDVEIIPGNRSAQHKVKLAAGKPGISAETTWVAENQYLHSLAADAKPVDEMRVAAAYALFDPELAESALAHAQQSKAAGADGSFFNAIAAMAFYRSCCYEWALSYAMDVTKKKGLPPEARPFIARVVFDSCYATFRWHLAKDLGEHDSRFKSLLPALTEGVDAYEQSPHPNAQLNPAAAKITFTDQVGNLVNEAPNANNEQNSSAIALAQLAQNKTYPFSTPGGSYTVCICGPEDANADFSADVQFGPSDNQPTKFVRVLRVGVDSNDQSSKTMEIYIDGSADIMPTTEMNPRLNLAPMVAGGRKFKLRMTIVGDRYEYSINGHRVLYGPMPNADGRKLTLSIQTVGITGQFSNVHWSTAPAAP